MKAEFLSRIDGRIVLNGMTNAVAAMMRTMCWVGSTRAVIRISLYAAPVSLKMKYLTMKG